MKKSRPDPIIKTGANYTYYTILLESLVIRVIRVVVISAAESELVSETNYTYYTILLESLVIRVIRAYNEENGSKSPFTQ